jgi:hypothetical protein
VIRKVAKSSLDAPQINVVQHPQMTKEVINTIAKIS